MPEPVIKYSRLRLTHRSHTGKKLHKSHTSYPLVAVLLLMVGVLLVASSLQVWAADVTVTATANGQPPIMAAQILSPQNNDHFTDSQVPVSGTCEAGFYIKLYRNDIFSGAGLCSTGGTFSITTDLFAGRNDLQARTYNIADNEGPRSNTVTVFYDLPVEPEPNPPTTTPGQNPGSPDTPHKPGGRPDASAPFYLSTEYFFRAAYTGQKITWDFEIFGGSSPYTAYAVWGDGYSDMKREINGNNFTVEHIYNTNKNSREFFQVTIKVVDANGYSAQLQLISIMNDPNVITGALVRPNDPSPLVSTKIFSGILKLAWSAYGVLVLMGVCYWLGERRGVSVTEAIYQRRMRRRANR